MDDIVLQRIVAYWRKQSNYPDCSLEESLRILEVVIRHIAWLRRRLKATNATSKEEVDLVYYDVDRLNAGVYFLLDYLHNENADFRPKLKKGRIDRWSKS